MAPQLGILQAFQLVREHLVVFVFADAQPFASGQQYIIAAESGNEAGIDQIGLVNPHKAAVFLAHQILHHIKFLVKGIAAVRGDYMGAPAFRGKIADFMHRDAEVAWADIVCEGSWLIEYLLVGEGGVTPQVLAVQRRHTI